MRCLRIRVTPSEHADLVATARENQVTVAALVRSAVDEYVADYRERAVFALV